LPELNTISKLKSLILTVIIIIILILLLFLRTEFARAGNFVVKTGYYVGSGQSGLSISGLGFQPDYVMIKSSTNAGAAVFKTSAMPANTIAFTTATADNTGTNITLNSDGFSVGTLVNVNTANVLYYYVAVGGSDCSSTGNFCVGTYTGNGASPRDINVGFVPTVAIVKQSTAVAANFRLASEPNNETLFLTSTARNTTGAYIQSFGSNYFRVGATNNTNLATYYYVTFKDTAGSFSQGTYTGNGTDDRNITGLGYTPNFVLVKNASSNQATGRNPVMNFTESYGDNSSYIGSLTANVVDGIQQLQNDGFQVGSSNFVNQNTSTIYWFTIGGADPPSAGIGSFNMATGNYTGTGLSNPVSGLGFTPDLVIVKANTAQLGVFRTTMMQGDSTAYIGSATTNFTGGIISIDSDGFTVGTATQTNTTGVVYQWQAYGGANNPYTNSGSADFMIGTYYGNGIAGRSISPINFEPDMITIKRLGATAGAWRPSNLSGDNTLLFTATAATAGMVQSIGNGGYVIGNNAAVNTAANLYHYFAFKNSSNFSVGSYTGTGSSQSISTAGMRAENVWVKGGAAAAVQRSISLVGESQYFIATANAVDRIIDFVKGGFRVGGNQAQTNTSGTTYYYAAWNNPNYGSLNLDIVDTNGQSVSSPAFSLDSSPFSFSCTSSNGLIGETNQKIRVSNLTNIPSWSVSVAPTSGQSALWRNVGDTERYDFNDPSGDPLGCADGLDGDSYAGQLTIDPSVATVTPEIGCSTGNISLGSQSSYSDGVIGSVEIANASSSSDADCIWDITNIGLSQRIPAEQPLGSYNLNLTVTIIVN
jgi:hypothetical protein